MAKSIMLEKAKDFAVEVYEICVEIKKENKETILTNQLMRSSTSIGANIHEANYASSKADFIAKLHISLKECYESEYWLELLARTRNLDDNRYKNLIQECGVIRRMLISSINTAKSNI